MLHSWMLKCISAWAFTRDDICTNLPICETLVTLIMYLYFNGLHSFFLVMVFVNSQCDSSLFIYQQGKHTTYLLLYVDDILLITSSFEFLHQIITTLGSEFAIIGLEDYFVFLASLLIEICMACFYLNISMLLTYLSVQICLSANPPVLLLTHVPSLTSLVHRLTTPLYMVALLVRCRCLHLPA